MEQTPEVEEAQERLQATLMAPSAPNLRPASPPSETESLSQLLGVLVTRVDQLAKTSKEQFDRQERVNAETVATMELARELIVQIGQQYDQLTDLIQRMETGLAALVRVNANLTEIVAALVAPAPQRG